MPDGVRVDGLCNVKLFREALESVFDGPAVQASKVQEEVGQEAQAEVGAALMVGAARGW